MDDFISVNPVDPTVIDIGCMEHGVGPWVSGTPLTEDNMPHPPVIHFLFGNLC